MSNTIERNEEVSDAQLSAKERADVLLALSKSAIDRFDRLSDVSWKLRVSVWTALGTSSAFMLSADNWKPGWTECIVGSLLTLAIVVVIVFFWSPFTYKRSTRFVRVARHWEAEVEKLVGGELPEYLLPKNFLGTGGWSAGDKFEPWYSQPVYVSQALVTIILGALVIMVLIAKTAQC